MLSWTIYPCKQNVYIFKLVQKQWHSMPCSVTSVYMQTLSESFDFFLSDFVYSLFLSLFILWSSLSLSIFQIYLNNPNAKCITQRTVNSIPASQTDCKGRQGSSGLVTQHTWCATPVAECSFCLWTLIWWPHWQSGTRDPWNMHGHLGSLAMGWSTQIYTPEKCNVMRNIVLAPTHFQHGLQMTDMAFSLRLIYQFGPNFVLFGSAALTLWITTFVTSVICKILLKSIELHSLRQLICRDKQHIT